MSERTERLRKRSAILLSLLVWRPTSVKTDDFSCCDFNRATTPSTHLSIISIFPHTLSFPILYPSTSNMCFQTIPVLSQPRSKNTHRQQRNPANLRPIATSSTTPLSFSVGLWNCQSAVNKADFISAFSLQSTLSILGLTETWIRPEDSATPGCSLSQFLFLSHPKASWPGWGHWSAHFKQLEILNPLSPRQSQLIWISCDYCNGSYKTPDSNNLPSPWPNSSHLPRGAGRPAVLFHGGWHSTLSLWRFQHSPRQALCYRLPFTPSFIWSQTPYHY